MDRIQSQRSFGVLFWGAEWGIFFKMREIVAGLQADSYLIDGETKGVGRQVTIYEQLVKEDGNLHKVTADCSCITAGAVIFLYHLNIK